MTRRTLLTTVVFVAAVGLSFAQAQKPLTNDDIRQMVKAGFSEETIIIAVQSSPGSFDTSVQSLLALKNTGVSEKIIGAMLAAKQAAPQGRTDSPTPKRLPDDVGVYVLLNEEPTEISVELVTWRTGAVGKSLLLGTRGHLNGVVAGPHSKLRLGTPLEFIVRCPENVDVGEYQLLKLDEKKDRREFRAVTGGFIHASGGTEKNAIPFRVVKAAPRTYKIELPALKQGEYGFLAPGGGQYGSIGGGVSGGMVTQGWSYSAKMYTFTVIE